MPAGRSIRSHMLSLCFFCALAAKWGPCEYSYGFLLHENRINSTQLPHPKAKGRPSKKAMAHASASGATLLPGTAQSEASTGSACPRPAHLVSQVCSAVQKLQSLLRAAQLGQLFPIMREQGAALQMLQTMHLADFKAFFGLSLVQAYNLHQLAVSRLECPALLKARLAPAPCGLSTLEAGEAAVDNTHVRRLNSDPVFVVASPLCDFWLHDVARLVEGLLVSHPVRDPILCPCLICHEGSGQPGRVSPRLALRF